MKSLFGVFATILIIVITIWFGVGVWSKISSGISTNPNLPNSITVSGDGEVYAKPDLGITSFSVVTDKITVAEAMAENTTKMNAVITAVKGQGVEEKDIKTTVFNIYPKYEWQQATCTRTICPPGKNILTGYEITQQIEVKVRDLTKVGDIIQKATDAGSNQVGSLQFTIDDEDIFKKQAREEAIAKAKTKAEDLAAQLGVKLGKIISFSENGNNPYPVYDYYTKAMGAGTVEAAAAPSIQTGENKIAVSVNITYEIK